MVEHVHRRASEAKLLDAVVVATDDQRIADAVEAFGGTAVMTDARHPSGTDRLAEVAAALNSDIIVNIQGDEPTIAPEAIDSAVKLLLDRPADQMATLRRRIDDPADLANPSVVKLVTDSEGYALYFTRSAVPFVRPGHPRPISWRHLGLYAYRREFLVRLASLATHSARTGGRSRTAASLSSTVIESLRRKHLPTRSASTHPRTWTACGSLLKRPHEPERTTCHRQTDSDL
jgi:3-deoxy-manno-octulosonate cytidylyltransferase (CMP-KDO synthetase)